uniref:Reticulophagy regulator family member 3 n=1 Tax=Callorhinchus milii TaxID=7868 RepID=A0A4W3HR60_CALMI|eukprot:gi/632966863/ref/XP_007899655.1/ PREDICTED: protein FAM134C [Callorhinchus milii]
MKMAVGSEPRRGLDPDHQRRVQGRQQQLLRLLGHHERLLTYCQSVLVWDRPWHSLLFHLSVNAGFWFLALTSLRLLFLIAFSLIVVVCADTWRNKIWPEIKEERLEDQDAESWGLVHPKLLSVPELCQRIAEIWVNGASFLENLYHFKKQNPGKFCLLVCGVFTFLAVIGRYVPGVLLSYMSLIGMLLWPLAIYHSVGQKVYARIEPLLERLDFSVKGYMATKQRERQLRCRAMYAGATDDGSDSEAELEAFCPQLDDSIVAKELEISDSEHSDAEVSCADNGTFNLSRGQSPITDGSEDLDRHSDPEESFARDLPEFPSINPDVTGVDDDDDASLGIPAGPDHLVVQEDDASTFSDQEDIDADISLSGMPSPLNFVGSQGFGLANMLAHQMMAAALSGASQETQYGWKQNPQRAAAQPRHEHSSSEMDTDAEADDFELLDQSELSQCESTSSQERGTHQHPNTTSPENSSSFTELIFRDRKPL